MVKIIYLIIFFAFAGLSNAQWEPDVRLTNDPGGSMTSNNNAWCVAASGYNVHVVWEETRDGNREIYYKRSTEGGINWNADTRLTNDSAESRSPSISVSGQVVYVVWYENRDTNTEIYFIRSTDGGFSWGLETRLTNNTFVSYYPSISSSESFVHVVWEDWRDGNREIYYKRSIDLGVSWGSDIRLTNDINNSMKPSVSASGSFVHIVFQDWRDGNREIYYKRSTDDGTSWFQDMRLTYNTNISGFPSVSASGSFVYVVWEEDRDANPEIYFKRSTDGGINWSADMRLTNDPADSYSPSISSSGTNAHVVWEDYRDGNNFEIFYKKTTNGGISWDSDTRLTNNSFLSRFSSVTTSGSYVHVVWFDQRDGNYEIYYKRDTTGNLVGVKNINSEIPSAFSLQQNYPNPFNPETNIKFNLPKYTFVSLKIFDILGREITTLVNEKLNAGSYSVDWNASQCSSGVYFYRLETEGFTNVRGMVFIK